MPDDPIVSERARVIRGHHSLGEYLVTKGAPDAATNTFSALGWALGDVRRRRALKRVIRGAGEVVAIGEAPEGMVRIEGRVEIVDAVTAPDGEAVALYRVHEERDEDCGCGKSCSVVRRIVRAVRDAGRFVVRDETGAALVERGAIVLRDYKGNALDPWAAGSLIVRQSDSVTVVGEGHRRKTGEPTGVSLQGYRDAQLPLVFEGTRESPTYVFGPPSDS